MKQIEEKQVDPHEELHQATELTLECIAELCSDPNCLPEEREAARYLAERIMNYRVLLRKRPLMSAYEYLNPPGQRPGWYYKPNEKEAEVKNWVGPFASRKEAVIAKTKRPGQARTPLHIIEQKLLGINPT